MNRKLIFFPILLHLNVIYGDVLPSNTFKTGPENECLSLLSSDLISEIRSYQPVVNQIVAAAINGTFSGSTWNRFVDSHKINPFVRSKTIRSALQSSPINSVAV